MNRDTRQAIAARTTNEIRSLLAEIANDTRRYRTIDALTEQIEHQYQGRFLVELIQNAHDAIPPMGENCPRRVCFQWEPTEGEHGTLYVANDGRPFDSENFRAITNLAQSSKDPAASIGHKGIGFRSVLEVCDSPEVYSASRQHAGRFDGYCFRFDPAIRERFAPTWVAIEAGDESIPWPADLTGAQPPELHTFRVPAGVSLCEEFAHLSAYALPLPADPARWPLLDTLAHQGYATAIRLPVRNEGARQTVESQLRKIDREHLLFLDRITEITVREGDSTRRYAATVVQEGEESGRFSVVIDSPQGPRRYWRWEQAVDADVLKEALRTLPERWHAMTDARVRLAVPRGDLEDEPGRLFIGLPTEQLTRSAARVEGPFFATDMSRRWVDLVKNPLNALLLRTLSALVADVCRNDLRDAGDEGSLALVDLLANDNGRLEWPDLPWSELAQVSLVPTQSGWVRPWQALWLDSIDATLVTPSRLREYAEFPVVDAACETRRSAWNHLIDVLHGPREASSAQIAKTIEQLAPYSEPATEVFWSDVNGWLRDSSKLRSHRVIPDDDGKLWPAGDGKELVFFPPDSEEADELASAVPAILRGRMTFLAGSLPLLMGVGREREQTAVRRYLDPLVKQFRREDILQLVVAAQPPETQGDPRSEDAQVRSELLSFGTRLVSAAFTENLLIAWSQLRLPCRGGWLSLDQAVIGDGWGDLLGDRVAAVLDQLGDREAAARLLLPPTDDLWAGQAGPLPTWFARLRELDHRAPKRGLQPTPITLDAVISLHRYSSTVLPDCSAVRRSVWHAYRDAVGPFQGTVKNSRRFDPVGFARLPGLEQASEMTEEARVRFARTVLESIAQWPATWRAAQLVREDQPNTLLCESFISWGLRELSWLTPAGSGASAKPSTLWFVEAATDEAALHSYLPLNLLNPSIATFLRDSGSWLEVERLGMPRLDLRVVPWAVRYLDDLAEAAGDSRVTVAMWDHHRPRVRAAWHTLAGQLGPDVDLPTRLVVERGNIVGCWMPDSGEQIVIPDDDRGLGFGSQPVMVIAETDAARVADQLITVFGASLCLRRSAQRVVAYSGTDPWIGQTVPTDAGEKSWMMHLALTLAENAQTNPLQAGSERYQRFVAALRGLRLALVDDLHVGIEGASTERRRSAAVLRLGNALLVDSRGEEAASEFGRALADYIERRDLAGDFAFVFDALGPESLERAPTQEQLALALRKVRLRPEDLEASRRRLAEGLEWIRRRLAPATYALGLKRGAVTSAESREELMEALAGALDRARATTFIERALRSRDDREMAQAFADEISLERWNAALRMVDPEAEPVSNEEAGAQIQRHLEGAVAPLRRWFVALLSGFPERILSAFHSIDVAMDVVPREHERSIEHWNVPFSIAWNLLIEAVMPDLVDVVDGSASGVLSAAVDPGTLMDTVNGVAAHVSSDPRAALNRALQVTGELKRTVLGYVALRVGEPQRNVLVIQLRSAFDALETALPLELDTFLGKVSASRLLQRVAKEIHETDEARVLLTAMLASEDDLDLRRRLAMTDADLVQGQRAAAQVSRQPPPTRMVAGASFPEDETVFDGLWGHLEAHGQLPDDWSLKDTTPKEAPGSLGAKHGGGLGGSGRRAARVSDTVRSLIGLAGEIIAYRALERRFPNLIEPSCWVSENRKYHFRDPLGDDRLGYDFRVRDDDITYLIEVKATSGDDLAFELGPTEVLAARGCSNEPRRGARTLYRVLYVRRALDRLPPSPLWLPNPFCSRDAKRFQVHSRSFRVAFALP